MNKKEKAKIIKKILNETFPDPKPPLCFEDPYLFLISVLLSAQSTDKKVNQIAPLLFAKAKTPEEMVSLGIPSILSIIRPIGLGPSKAKSIFLLSKELIKKHKGKVPTSLSALESLPGVGHKTASVVLALAFHKSAFPVDTHIHRVAKRWGLSRGKTVTETEKDLKKLFLKKEWIKTHLQMVLFAREFCTARGHETKKCPICRIL